MGIEKREMIDANGTKQCALLATPFTEWAEAPPRRVVWSYCKRGHGAEAVTHYHLLFKFDGTAAQMVFHAPVEPSSSSSSAAADAPWLSGMKEELGISTGLKLTRDQAVTVRDEEDEGAQPQRNTKETEQAHDTGTRGTASAPSVAAVGAKRKTLSAAGQEEKDKDTPVSKKPRPSEAEPLPPLTFRGDSRVKTFRHRVHAAAAASGLAGDSCPSSDSSDSSVLSQDDSSQRSEDDTRTGWTMGEQQAPEEEDIQSNSSSSSPGY
jgi:hypothetical protein